MATLSLNSPPAHAPSSEKTRREHVEKVSMSLCRARTDYEGQWYSIADFSGYGSLPCLSTDTKGKARPNHRQLMDSHPILAFRTVEGGMYSGLSSPNRL